MEKIPTTVESMHDKIKRLLKEVHQRMDILEFNEKMIAFAEKIRKNHPDYQQYRCYHQLTSSSVPADMKNIVDKDFEGEDSVITFLEGLLKTG